MPGWLQQLLLFTYFGLLACLALAVPVVVVVWVWRSAIRSSPLAPSRTGRWRQAAVLAGLLATVTYLWGAMVGGLLSLRPSGAVCGGDLAAAPRQWLFPLSNVCTFTDGRTVDLVPAAANWIAIVGILLALGLFAAGWLMGGRKSGTGKRTT